MAEFKHGRISMALALAFLASPSVAHAQRELLTRTGQKGQLAIDQISGMRLGVNPNGPALTYYGPVGVAFQSYSQATGDFPGATATVHQTTVWLAPSADVFVIDHLSVGGLVEIASTSGSIDTPKNPGQTVSTDLQTLTTFTLLPRVGWLFALGDRWGIWPRAGIGYTSQGLGGTAGTNVRSDDVHGLILDLDVGFLFRLNETFFLRAAPEIGWLPSGSHSVTDNLNRTTSFDASYVQFTLTGGIGVFFDL